MKIRYPILYTPTPASRHAAMVAFRNAGICLAGKLENSYSLDNWENVWGVIGDTNYVGYYEEYNGWAFISDDRAFDRLKTTHTLVNSIPHFINYVKKHKLPCAS